MAMTIITVIMKMNMLGALAATMLLRPEVITADDCTEPTLIIVDYDISDASAQCMGSEREGTPQKLMTTGE